MEFPKTFPFHIKKSLLFSAITSLAIMNISQNCFALYSNTATQKHHAKKSWKKKYPRTRHRHRYHRRNRLKYVQVIAKPLPISLMKSNIKEASSNKKNSQKMKSFYFNTDSRKSKDNSSSAFATPFGQPSWPEMRSKYYFKEDKAYAYYHGYKLQLTLVPKLQAACQKNLKTSHALGGSTVVLDPETGRILAMCQVEHPQKMTDSNGSSPTTAQAPAASLMKIITASAAIEKEHLSPFDSVRFRGGCSVLRNENWISSPHRDHQYMTFAMAFGSSCNTVFARLALYDAGLSSLKNYAERFFFNQPIPSDLKIETSQFTLPALEFATAQEVAEAGAGFGATKLSPIHAAMLSAAIQNRGLMMAPFLVENATDTNGKIVYRAQNKTLAQVIAPQTASKIQTLMQETVSTGTSRRVFRRRGTRFEIDEIGGKTGTLSDLENRKVLYTWFSGIAPLNSPSSIAIGTVIASLQNWVVRASHVAQTTLAEYFRIEKKYGKFPKPKP